MGLCPPSDESRSRSSVQTMAPSNKVGRLTAYVTRRVHAAGIVLLPSRDPIICTANRRGEKCAKTGPARQSSAAIGRQVLAPFIPAERRSMRLVAALSENRFPHGNGSASGPDFKRRFGLGPASAPSIWMPKPAGPSRRHQRTKRDDATRAQRKTDSCDWGHCATTSL